MVDEDLTGITSLQRALARVGNKSRLSSGADDVDQIIELLTAARNQIAAELDPHTTSLTITKLQNPIKEGFETINKDLKDVYAAHKKVGSALDKNFPQRPLPADHDAMDEQTALINRAIAMHLLREGQFSVASTFIEETQDAMHRTPYQPLLTTEGTPSDDLDEPMDEDDPDIEASPPMTASTSGYQDLPPLQSRELQIKFSEMYHILQELKNHRLSPAIEWARSNSSELEARGSNLEFELSKLQFVWLFKGPAVNGLPDGEQNGRQGAMAYARYNFGRFQPRHLFEIQQLAGAMAYASNIGQSPYRVDFSIDGSFAEVASSFTREFCSLLGLSAESPLYIAATAGALALPVQVKFNQMKRQKNTEWTTQNELPFETPLPERMVYHSIFVCPVSKEQTTEANPPMMIPCGHVLARETLQRMCKGTKLKCPYCPSEGQIKDAKQIIL